MTGIDIPIKRITDAYTNHLWSDSQYYGRIYPNEKDDGLIPELSSGGNEYKELLLNDKTTATSFFYVLPERGNPATVYIHFSINLKKAYPTLGRDEASEKAILQAKRITETAGFLIDDDGTITGAPAFDTWTFINQNKMDMNKFFLFRLETTIQYDGICEAATKTTYNLNLSTTGGGITEPYEGSEAKDINSTHPINAVSDDGFDFSRWLINGVEDLNRITTVYMNKTVNAIAEFIQYFTLNISSNGNGSTTPVTGSYDIESGTYQEIEAIPDAENEFTEWGIDGDIITDNPYQLLINGAKNVIAYFAPLLSYQWIFTGDENEIVALDSGGYGYKNYGTGDIEQPIGNIQTTTIITGESINLDVDLSGQTKATISMRVKQLATDKTMSVEQRGSLHNRIGLSVYKNGLIFCILEDTTNQYATVTANAIDFKTITMVFDGTLIGNVNRMKLYIDGTSKTLNFTGDVPSIVPTIDAKTIISSWNGVAASDGSLEYFSIWKDALTIEQIVDRDISLGLESLAYNSNFQESEGLNIKDTSKENNTGIAIADPATLWASTIYIAKPKLLIDGYTLYQNIATSAYLREQNGYYDNDNVVPIIILTGQSNAESFFNISLTRQDVIDLLPESYKGEQLNIQTYWEGSYLNHGEEFGQIENMQVPDNTVYWERTDPLNSNYNRTGWGIEQKAAHLLQEDKGKNVIVIKVAQSGLAISHWESPSGSMWIQLKRHIEKVTDLVIADSKIPHFISMAWVQGESGLESGYETALKNVVQNTRAVNDYTEFMKIALFKLSDNNTQSSAFKLAINTAMENVALSECNCVAINTDGLAILDGQHYSDVSLMILSEKWFNTFSISTDYNKLYEIPPNAGFSNTGNTVNWVNGDAATKAVADHYGIPYTLSFAQMSAIDFSAIPDNVLKVIFEDNIFKDWECNPDNL